MTATRTAVGTKAVGAIISTMIAAKGAFMGITAATAALFRVEVAATGSANHRTRSEITTRAVLTETMVVVEVEAISAVEIAATVAVVTVAAAGWATTTVETSTVKVRTCATQSLNATEAEAEARSDMKHGY